MITKITNPPTQKELIDKINEIIDGSGSTITIDSSFDKNSTNPVQNKVITQAIENISLAKNPNLNLIGGNLNIDSGNVSGFSTTDYMQFPFVFNFNGYTWTLEMGFTTGSNVTTQQNILDSYYGIAFAINNGKFLMALSSNGSSWNIGSTSGAYSVQANTAYSTKIAWDGTKYTLSYALDETNYTTDITISSSAVHHSTQEYVGGEPELFESGSQHPFTGTINLNNWSLIVNGLEVWLGMDDVGLGSRANIDLSNLTEAGLAKFQTPLVSGENIKTINGESILGNGNITIQSGGTVDQVYDPTSSNAQSGIAIAGANFLTSADLPTNYVTTDTVQDISGRKTFLGEKAIYFKQQATSNKLGFTLYNPSNTELAALEYRPNTISGASLLALNCPQTTGGYVGFRYWGTPAVNIVAPKVATAGNYFMATHITNGTLTVTANNQGTVDISSLLPDVSNYVTNSTLATTLADYVTNSALTTTLADYALTADIPTKTSELTNDSNFATVAQIPTNNNQLTNGAGYITNSALNGYATENFVTSQGYITGITSSDVTTALGYTPYNSSNPSGYQANKIETIKVNGTAQTITSKAVDITVPTNNNQLTNGAGYITSSALNGYAKTTDLAMVATTGDYNDLSNKPTIPIVNNGTLTIQKNGTTVGTFTANQSTNSTINIEADTVLTDDITVSKNSDDELQTIGVIDDNVQNAYNFTVVGSPTITDDGIASGFSDSNYLTSPTINIGTNWVLETEFIINSYSSIQQIFRALQGTSFWGQIYIAINGRMFAEFVGISQYGLTPADTPITLGSKYKVRIVQQGGFLESYLSKDDSEYVRVNKQPTQIAPTNNVFFRFGYGYNSTYMLNSGSIDLKQFSITVDGVEVYRAWQPPALKYWTGTKAQYDALTFDNYTVVGSPTITDDGIASGFSSSNYIVPNNLSYFASAITDFDFYVPFKLSNYPAARELVARGQYNNSFRFLIAIDGNRTAKFNFNTFDSETIVIPATDLELNVNYIIKLSLHQGTLKYGYYKNNTYTETGSMQVSSIDTMNWLRIGSGNNNAGFVDGSIDLKQFSITVDGKEVYRAFGRPDANTLYNVEGVGLYKGTTLISNDGANKDLSNLSATGQAVIDGQWVEKYLSVFSGVTAIGNGDYSISSYLPNDGHAYEVLACMQMNDDGATSGTDSAAAVGNVANPLDNNCFRIMGNSDKGIWKPRFNGVLVFLGNQRKVYYQIKARALTQGLALWFFGYRRIGTNS